MTEKELKHLLANADEAQKKSIRDELTKQNAEKFGPLIDKLTQKKKKKGTGGLNLKLSPKSSRKKNE